MKNVQIPQELFFDLVRYFILGDTSEERFKAVLKANIEFLKETHKEYQNPLTNSCIASYLENLK